MSGSFPAAYAGRCARCTHLWDVDDEIAYVRECLLHPPESRRSMTSTQLGRTVTVCVPCAREVSR